MNLPKFNYLKFIYFALFLFLVWPSRFAVFRYENIAGEDIYDNLIKKTSKNLSLFHDKGVQCVSCLLKDFQTNGSGTKKAVNVTQIRAMDQ